MKCCGELICGTCCFPSDVKVLYENGTLGMMSELQIGDKIQTSMKIRKLKTIIPL